MIMIHYSMDIDLNKVIDIFAMKRPRRMEPASGYLIHLRLFKIEVHVTMYLIT